MVAGARRLPGFPRERLLALVHCILGHHGPDALPGRRFGSPEALALARLNALDAQVKGALEHGLPMKVAPGAADDFEARRRGCSRSSAAPRSPPTRRPTAGAVFEAPGGRAGSAPLVVEDEAARVIACCSLHFRPRLNRPVPDAWIPDLIVHRRRPSPGCRPRAARGGRAPRPRARLLAADARVRLPAPGGARDVRGIRDDQRGLLLRQAALATGWPHWYNQLTQCLR